MISFIFCTCRRDPHLDWFVDSLCLQLVPDVPVQLVVVDFDLQYEETNRRAYVANIIQDRIDYIHVPPKPSPWQGKYRLTQGDRFSASVSRNTGVCYTKYDYICFVDDLSVLTPNSFSHIVQYAKAQQCVSFSYKKVFDLQVNQGTIVGVRETDGGTDSRLKLYNQFTKISGSQVYGFSAFPLAVVLQVNGYDEICNGSGGEDYHMGIRIEKAGHSVYYSTAVRFFESDEVFHRDQGRMFIRRDPLLTTEHYNTLLAQYGVKHRWDPKGRTDLSHFLLDLVTRDQFWAEGNTYNLGELRATIQNGGAFAHTFDPAMVSLEGTRLSLL